MRSLYVLYAVTMDSWTAARPYDLQHPTLPPPELSYKDATYLARSNIPQRKVIMTTMVGMMSGAPGQGVPLRVMTRATTKDFFAMFDVPFEYGGGWRGNDLDAVPEIVLTKEVNDTLFGGIDSVGRSVLWNGNRFRVVGVLREWEPLPRFYDLVDGPFAPPEEMDQVFVPFSWVTALQASPASNMSCTGAESIRNYQQFLTSDCIWIQMWVELRSAASRDRFQAYMDAYWAVQHRAGRFPRPLDNRLTEVSQWLEVNGVVSSDSRILLRVAFAFLAVCLINTVGILLTKFLRGAPIIGVRRALGASRRQIFMQHIVEVAVVSVTGGLLGLGLGAIGLAGVRAMYAQDSTYGMLAHFDPLGVSVRSGAYLKVNLGALPQELIEAELFGTEAGAFTGARARVGRFEAANGGTLFLDELGNLAPAGQAKLLRVLQTGELERLGSNVTRRTHVRMIAATNSDLRAAIREGRFREDLYYRLNVIELELPPLSRRREDILPLARHFLAAGRELSPEAVRALVRHSWPGNVRELQNVIRRACLLSSTPTIAADALGLPAPEQPDLTGEPAVDRASIEQALQRSGGVVAHAARDLGLSRQALYRRMEKLGIKSD